MKEREELIVKWEMEKDGIVEVWGLQKEKLGRQIREGAARTDSLVRELNEAEERGRKAIKGWSEAKLELAELRGAVDALEGKIEEIQVAHSIVLSP